MHTIDRTLARLRDHLNMDIAYISEVTDTDIFVRALYAPDLPNLPNERITLERETGFCHYIINGEIPPILHDVSSYPSVANLAMRTDFNIQAFMGLPLLRPDGSVYGTLCCISHKPNPTLNERDLETIKLFAEFAAEQIDDELEDRRVSDARGCRIQSIWDQKLLRINLQPIVRLSDMKYKGFEALARFDTVPYRSPDKWFLEASLAGRGVELEVEAVRVALRSLLLFPSTCTLSVNVSPECLNSEELNELLSNQDPSQIILELTEHTEIVSYCLLIQSVQKFQKMGYKLAVDDAGAGYSNLSHIVQIQPDFIKLDLSLTRNIHLDKARRSLARALVFFAQETGAEIVAEGIETVEEMTTLTELGVDFGQGYFFDKALEIDQAVKCIKLGTAAKFTVGRELYP
jgi:EAL domain-containing protein (putative c-di-GMP-specific phosphodiesterase class I)